jgi:preprotein translocase subunit SecD
MTRLAGVGLLAAVACSCQSAPQPSARTTTTTTTTTPPPTSTTTVAPILRIQPLAVRPVTKSQLTTPEKCPQPNAAPAAAPNAALTTCDIARTTKYTLGPEAMQLGLINVDPPKALTADFFEVTLILDPPSADAWAAFTAAHLKDHMAFIRDDQVLEAPIIEEQVTSGRIALTTQTSQGAAQLAQLAGRAG